MRWLSSLWCASALMVGVGVMSVAVPVEADSLLVCCGESGKCDSGYVCCPDTWLGLEPCGETGAWYCVPVCIRVTGGEEPRGK